VTAMVTATDAVYAASVTANKSGKGDA
jgi:hypothetical protein